MSSTAASGGTAPRVASQASRELRLRAISVLVLAPFVLVAVYLGGAVFQALVAGTAALMAWEWERLCNGGRFTVSGMLMVTGAVAVILAIALGRADVAALLGAAATIAVYAVTAAARRPDPRWVALGMVVIATTAGAIVWLRLSPLVGAAGLLWFIGVVWATDLGGYVVGRTVGGPRLAPVVSPRKTWAGLAGGMAFAAAWGFAASQFWHFATPWKLAFLALVLAVIEQIGDLSVSVVKRRYGAKDSSNLIPGHGGVLDRTDGFLVAAPVLVVLIVAATGGFAS